jgi:hypothetical protein
MRPFPFVFLASHAACGPEGCWGRTCRGRAFSESCGSSSGRLPGRAPNGTACPHMPRRSPSTFTTCQAPRLQQQTRTRESVARARAAAAPPGCPTSRAAPAAPPPPPPAACRASTATCGQRHCGNTAVSDRAALLLELCRCQVQQARQQAKQQARQHGTALPRALLSTRRQCQANLNASMPESGSRWQPAVPLSQPASQPAQAPTWRARSSAAGRPWPGAHPGPASSMSPPPPP